VRAAQAVHDHRTPDLPGLRAALPISDAPGSALVPGGSATTAISYLFFDDSANLDERTATAERYGQRYLGGAGQAVVGATGAAPARLAQYEEIRTATAGHGRQRRRSSCSSSASPAARSAPRWWPCSPPRSPT
jgi:hypothetical protein